MFVKVVWVLIVLNYFNIGANSLGFFNSRNEKDFLEILIENSGYSVKAHNIWTEDSYRIRLHRISKNNHYRNINFLSLLSSKFRYNGNVFRKKIRSIEKKSTKEPILLVHGLMCSGSMWIANSTNSLAYLLVDAGYDVWLFSARGTSPSMQHKNLSSASAKFWDFSWHEIGYYDLPRAIDFILEATQKKKLSLVGHSQGTTAFIVTMTLRQKYNEKISAAYLLAPAVYLEHAEGLIGLAIETKIVDYLERFLKQTNTQFLHVRQTLLVDSIVAFCQDPNINRIFSQLINFITGPGSEPTVDVFNMVINLIKYVGDNASVKQLVHYIQIIRSGKFQHFDYGHEKNELYYKDSNPPAYNLSLVQVPLIFITLTKDAIIIPEDAEKLLLEFSNVFLKHVIIPGNHVDFMFDPKAINLIKDEILSYSKK